MYLLLCFGRIIIYSIKAPSLPIWRNRILKQKEWKQENSSSQTRHLREIFYWKGFPPPELVSKIHLKLLGPCRIYFASAELKFYSPHTFSTYTCRQAGKEHQWSTFYFATKTHWTDLGVDLNMPEQLKMGTCPSLCWLELGGGKTGRS